RAAGAGEVVGVYQTGGEADGPALNWHDKTVSIDELFQSIVNSIVHELTSFTPRGAAPSWRYWEVKAFLADDDHLGGGATTAHIHVPAPYRICHKRAFLSCASASEVFNIIVHELVHAWMSEWEL